MLDVHPQDVLNFKNGSKPTATQVLLRLLVAIVFVFVGHVQGFEVLFQCVGNFDDGAARDVSGGSLAVELDNLARRNQHLKRPIFFFVGWATLFLLCTQLFLANLKVFSDRISADQLPVDLEFEGLDSFAASRVVAVDFDFDFVAGVEFIARECDN